MSIFFQALFSGVAQGAIYALIALGYSVIFRTLKMGHLAQGDFYMIGAFFGMTLAGALGMPTVVVFVGAALCTSVLMLLIERIAYRRMYNRPSISLLIVTMGMQYVVQWIARFFWGSDIQRSTALFPNSSIEVFSVVMTMQNIAVISICTILVIALTLFMKKTKTGVAMSAVSMNRKAAALMGVKTNTIIMATYVIAACLAAVAGTLMGPVYSVSFNMGTIVGTKALTAAVMGGFGNLPGAVLGGVLLGVIETLCGLYISTAYKDVFSFIILVIVLFWRPQGILGKASITKV